MGIEKKTPGALTANDKEEGRSEQGKAAFRKLCDGLTEKQKSDMNLGRALNPEAKEVRRVTRDLVMKIFALKNTDKEAQKIFWREYFGGPPPDIAEFVRRRIIQEGNIRDYGERIGLSHATLGNILDTHMITYASLKKLRKANEPFPWGKKELMKRWRTLSTAYRMSDEERPLNEMAARMETLFEMRPTASRTQWVDLNNPPASLKDMSQNKRRILMSDVRHGKPVPWEEVDRILVGLNCDLEERMEVASAWIAARNEAPREKVSKGKTDAQATARGSKEETSGAKSEKKVLQSQAEYPEHLSGKADLHIIASLLTELTGHDASDVAADEHRLKERVDGALGTPGAIAVTRKKRKKKSEEIVDVTSVAAAPSTDETPAAATSVPAASNAEHPEPDTAPTETEHEPVDEEVPDPPAPDTPTEPSLPAHVPLVLDERTLFGEEDLSEDDDERLMSFSQSRSVWTIAEYARNFLCTESAGYGPNQEEEFTELAAEVNVRAPLGINDTANALKMLLYSYGRHSDHPATAMLLDAVGKSFLQEEFPVAELLTLLIKEPRFSAFLIYYRDNMPESAITDVLSQFLHLPGVEVPSDFDPNVITDRDEDYEDVIRPRPPEERPTPVDSFEAQKAETRKKRRAELDALARELARKQPIGTDDHAKRERLELLRREQEAELRAEEAADDED